MEGTPDTVQDQYQIMDENSAATPAPAPTSSPTPTPPAAPAPVLSPSTAPSSEQTIESNFEDNVQTVSPVGPVAKMTSMCGLAMQQSQANSVDHFDPQNKDLLVILFSVTRFLTAVSIISGVNNMYSQDPGTNYIMAGIFLFGSVIGEFLSLLIDKITFASSLISSIIIIIAGVLSIDDGPELEVKHVGIMWAIASLILAASHTWDVVTSYGKVNTIILVSKVSAVTGATLFLVAGLIMFSIEDAGVDDIWKYSNFFSSGGMMYMVHAVTMCTGNKVVLNHVFSSQTYKQQNPNQGIQMV